MNKLTLARTLVILGFTIGLASLFPIISHIGDPDFLLVGGDTVDHGYYHFFREAGGDIAAMIAVLYFLFSPSDKRNSTTWTMSFIIAVGYYAPYWAGMPFNESLAAPHISAEIGHVLQASLVFIGLIVAKQTITQEAKG